MNNELPPCHLRFPSIFSLGPPLCQRWFYPLGNIRAVPCSKNIPCLVMRCAAKSTKNFSFIRRISHQAAMFSMCITFTDQPCLRAPVATAAPSCETVNVPGLTHHATGKP